MLSHPHRAALVLAVVSAAALFAGCATLAVHSYARRDVDLRQYRTFAWDASAAVATGDPRLDSNEIFDARVRTAVERELEARGFEKTSATPDLLVHYHAIVAQKIDAADPDRPGAACAGEDCAPYVYDAGTLFVDLLDARTRALLWRGWAEGAVDGAIDDQDWMEARIDESVTRILQRVPRAL
jgi:Domain of unknown function (DUF4136)